MKSLSAIQYECCFLFISIIAMPTYKNFIPNMIYRQLNMLIWIYKVWSFEKKNQRRHHCSSHWWNKSFDLWNSNWTLFYLDSCQWLYIILGKIKFKLISIILFWVNCSKFSRQIHNADHNQLSKWTLSNQIETLSNIEKKRFWRISLTWWKQRIRHGEESASIQTEHFNWNSILESSKSSSWHFEI